MKASVVVILVFALALTTTDLVAQTGFNKLVWADEFSYDGKPDSSKWGFDLGKGHPNGWGNNEEQYYTNASQNVRVENGMLIIEAHRQEMEGKAFTSSRMKSKGKGDWLHGRFEVRAKLPSGRGTWPAIWMLPSENRYGGWPKSGEIDIMEHVGYDAGVVHGTIHTEAYNHNKGTQKGGQVQVPDATETFHVYAMEWDADNIRFFVDDNNYYSILREKADNFEGWPFDQPFHLILNIAVGGNWGGREGVDHTIWPRRMEIDYVRVYQ